jgi:integrase
VQKHFDLKTTDQVPDKPKLEAEAVVDDTRTIRVRGVRFEESFVADLISRHMAGLPSPSETTIEDAYKIYMRETAGQRSRKFYSDAAYYFGGFMALFGNMRLAEIRHFHAAQYRDYQLKRGLHPTSVRKHINLLNAMLNCAFKHLGLDRLSPFRQLSIVGEGESAKTFPEVSVSIIKAVKDHLLGFPRSPHCLIGLVQLNTGMRISEPVFARREDLVLEHDIPHLWVRRNQLSFRKTKSSIRAVPLVGASLEAAQALAKLSDRARSEWLVPLYAREIGNTTCSASLNKTLKPLQFTSHMFRHAFIDRLKACGDIPVKLAESITGHSSGGSDFDHYGTVGYSLEQKLAVIKRVEV